MLSRYTRYATTEYCHSLKLRLSPADLESERQVLTADGKKLAFDWECAFVETSSLTGENVELAFVKSTALRMEGGMNLTLCI